MKYLLIIILLLTLALEAFSSVNIVFLGDSLSEGLGVDEAQSFPRLVEKKLREKKHDVIIINGGLSGATTASGEGRLKWYMKKRVDMVVLELGANDGLRGLKIEETRKNLDAIIQIAKNNKIKILLLGLAMPPNYGKKYTADFAMMYRKLSKSNKIPILPFVLKDVEGVSTYNQADGIHPNVQGHEIIATNVALFVEKNL